MRNATIYGGRVCDCGSSLRTRLFRGDEDDSIEDGAATTPQPAGGRRGGNDPRVLRRTVGSASQATACLELFDECKVLLYICIQASVRCIKEREHIRMQKCMKRVLSSS